MSKEYFENTDEGTTKLLTAVTLPIIISVSGKLITSVSAVISWQYNCDVIILILLGQEVVLAMLPVHSFWN